MNRRDLLKLSAAGGLASLLPNSLFAAAEAKPLRIAHVTDVHVLPNETARGGFARAMKAVYESKNRPDLILVGGDCVMDAVSTPADEVAKQWGEWHAVLKDYREIPIRAVLGNHDYHWTKEPTGDALAQREEGAKHAVDQLKMPGRFSTFDQGGWRFLLLDSLSYKDRQYRAVLDGPQMEWLKEQIGKTPKTMPIVVLSHVPIFSACAFYHPAAHQQGHYVIPETWMHADAVALKDLFLSHGNVRLCLSGHMHQNDEIVLSGTRYVCTGAVSGNWWKGKYFDTDPGFGLVTLHPDGRIENRYVAYGSA